MSTFSNHALTLQHTKGFREGIARKMNPIFSIVFCSVDQVLGRLILLFPTCNTISTQEPRGGVMLPAGLRPGGGPNGARRVRAGQRV
jgi:hypothetical protein